MPGSNYMLPFQVYIHFITDYVTFRTTVRKSSFSYLWGLL